VLVGVTVNLQWFYSGVTVVRLLHMWYRKCYAGVTVVLQWCYKSVRGPTLLARDKAT
jgi:hypothetical protein